MKSSTIAISRISMKFQTSVLLNLMKVKGSTNLEDIQGEFLFFYHCLILYLYFSIILTKQKFYVNFSSTQPFIKSMDNQNFKKFLKFFSSFSFPIFNPAFLKSPLYPNLALVSTNKNIFNTWTEIYIITCIISFSPSNKFALAK